MLCHAARSFPTQLIQPTRECRRTKVRRHSRYLKAGSGKSCPYPLVTGRPSRVLVLGGLRQGLTRGGVEEQDLVLPVLVAEVEHVVEAARHGVERPADVAQTPVAFDEADDRGLVRAGVVHEVRASPRGDNERWRPRAEAAPAHLTAQRLPAAAGPGPGQRVGGTLGGVG